MRDRALTPCERFAGSEDPVIAAIVARWPLRELVTRSRALTVQVDRERALYGAWYEFFPRSEGAQVDPAGQTPPVSGTLRTAARRLDAVAVMGFDVVYLPPVHPIGTTFRKGRNNTLIPRPGDPGSPWAIGSPDGRARRDPPGPGHVRGLRRVRGPHPRAGHGGRARPGPERSPDHPWVHKHPEWFTTRADGSIAYAENPPKKYQDIYPLNFDNDPEGIYAEVLRVVRLWMDHGVRIFRVDNPHTKPVRFWERLLDRDPGQRPRRAVPGRGVHPPGHDGHPGQDRLPPVLHVLHLAERRAGADRVHALSCPVTAAPYMRPNFFTNTPDILHAYLQYGGLPAFRIRAVLAAMLSPTWGIYSGFELGENVPLRPGSEEYLDSEKYQYRPRDWAGAGRARLRHRALHHRAQPDPAGAPGPAPAAESALPSCRPAGTDVLLQADE